MAQPIRLTLFASSLASLLACTATSSGGGTGLSAGIDEVGESTAAMRMDLGTHGSLDLEDHDVSEIAEVFGHSADTLYKLNPETKAVSVVGTFDGCDASIIDIALDADSHMFGTAYGSLYSIDRKTAACTLIAEGDYPTSLSFVPAGTVDAAEEALVGFVDDQYIRIDVQTGDVTELGVLPDDLRSSGDLVSVKDGDTWLTVIGPGCETGDCIVSLDPATGDVIQNFGPLPYIKVFGLAFWAGRAYGFSEAGELFQIDFGDTDVSTMKIEVPDAPSGLSFYGAGSTTSAPPQVG